MSKGGFIGYTYQKHVTELFLSKMDTERNINVIQIEAKTDDNFEDLVIRDKRHTYQIQIKDIAGIKLENLSIAEGKILISNKPHKLSSNVNIVFFNNIGIIPNSKILGFEALKMADVYLISLNREQIDEVITGFYEPNPFRRSIIQKFLSTYLDERKWVIQKNELPVIDVFNTNLVGTVDLKREIIDFEDILHIEGKPGIGKSHLVDFLQKQFSGSLLYRFWISEQDKDKEERLKYNKFLFDISKKIFGDFGRRDEDEIIDKLKLYGSTVIIDGLDHVKNHNPTEFKKFVGFIDQLKLVCRVIVLSRPIECKLGWKKQQLTTWTKQQTDCVLEELYHISDYDAKWKIFEITGGYPIIVRYVAKQYKSTKTLPKLGELTSLDSYYEQILKGTKVKSLLSLFLCSRAYFMRSEISMFLGEESAEPVCEFIDEHPYLFEIRLNRISLFHDSFTTYLQKQNIDYSQKQSVVSEIVFNSIISSEKRFLSRFNSISLSLEQKYKILSKFTVMQSFKELMQGVVDFEAIQSFYVQLREELEHFSADDFEVINYYDLSLIFNLISKDHVSTVNSFQHTYIKALLFNGYTEEDITSSKYLFSMLYYYRTNDAALLFNALSDDNYSTERFLEELEDDIAKEESYFELHQNPFSKQEVSELLKREYLSIENVSNVITNLFVFNTRGKKYSRLIELVKDYLKNSHASTDVLGNFLVDNGLHRYLAYDILKSTKQNILGLGKESYTNDYINLSINDFIVKNKHLGSVDLRVEVHNYIRLSVHQKRKIDIQNISRLWTKYYDRHDYSFISIAPALKVFERKNFITIADSCKLIMSVQDASEKGYRGLFNTYIKEQPVEIIDYLQRNFGHRELGVLWFNLPARYINMLSDNVFQSALIDKLKYSDRTDFEELENVFKSNRFEELKLVLSSYKRKVRVAGGNRVKEWLILQNIEIDEYVENKWESSKNSEERYREGTLTIKDIEFITKEKLKCHEVAGCSDGSYFVLADLEIYKSFERNEVAENIKEILYNAVLGKVRRINSYCMLHYLAGNVPKLIDDYGINVDFIQMFASFRCLVDMSLFDLGGIDDEMDTMEGDEVRLNSK